MRTIARHEIEASEEWRKWIEQIPALQFKPEWCVKVIPPFGGAMARFWIDCGEAHCSVYLDCHEAIGYYGSPYWEVYPVDGDVGRVAIHDAAGLIELIDQSISEQSGSVRK